MRDYINSLRYEHELLNASDERQGMIERALIIGVIGLARIIAYTQTALGSTVTGIFEDSKAQLETS